MNFVPVISQKRNQQSSSNFYSILCIIRNRKPPYSSVLTHPWRHLGAILWFHIIIHIFITIHHKLPKFSTDKLQVIIQHTDNPCPRACHDAHVRARPNFKMLKITYTFFWVRTRSFRAFQNFPSVRVRARKRSKFKMFTWFRFLIRQLTISIHLQSLLTFHKAVRARQSLKSARAAMGNIMQKWAKIGHFWNLNSSSELSTSPNFYIMVGKSMSWRYDFIPPCLVESETKSSYWHLNSKKKSISFGDVIFVFVQLRLSRLPVIDFLPDFAML